jgi:hypothetical protein
MGISDPTVSALPSFAYIQMVACRFEHAHLGERPDGNQFLQIASCGGARGVRICHIVRYKYSIYTSGAMPLET